MPEIRNWKASITVRVGLRAGTTAPAQGAPDVAPQPCANAAPEPAANAAPNTEGRAADLTPKIAKLAYFFYEKEGRRDGHAPQDWKKAEQALKPGAEVKPAPVEPAEGKDDASVEPTPSASRIVVDALAGLKMSYPKPTAKRRRGLAAARRTLVGRGQTRAG